MRSSSLGGVIRREPDEVLSLLRERAISHEVIEHKPVYTCREAALARRVPLHNELKTLLIIYNAGLALLNLPGDMRVNRAKVRRILTSHDFRLANSEEMRKLQVSTGTVSPLSLDGCRSLLDQEVLNINWVTTNAGRLTVGLRIGVYDLIRVCHFEVANFASV